MRITIDHDRCEGHGLCQELAPEVFELDDAGSVRSWYESQDVPADLEHKASLGASVCPVAVLRISGLGVAAHPFGIMIPDHLTGTFRTRREAVTMEYTDVTAGPGAAR
jgi:ferredoxin